MIHFVLLFNRQGKIRLSKWYSTYSSKERTRVIRDLTSIVPARRPRDSAFVLWRDLTIIYKRYAGLYFVMGVDRTDNELLVLEVIHKFVVVLDRMFSNVCELDLIFEFDRVYMMLDEFILAGEMQEPSTKVILQALAEADEHERAEVLNEVLTDNFA